MAENKALVMPELPELAQLMKEATQSVEDELLAEDTGWIRISGGSNDIITDASRNDYLKLSRLYYYKDPLAKQAIRLWTDYTFGTGVTWSCEDDKAKNVLNNYWNLRDNQTVLSAKGQRRASTKLLVDGELFMALFLGAKETRIRFIDPLEITEVITDPDDKDNERYYKRTWSDTQGTSHTDYYCSHRNPKDEGCKDSTGVTRKATANAKNVLVYHLPWDNLGNRGIPLLLPALDWIKQYRRFLASRVGIMLALARFAFKAKTKGGATAIATVKGKLDGQEIPAGSTWIENEGVTLDSMKIDTGSTHAYNDGRMLKLQVAAAVGIPEQYFGDISSGNLATARTVELPMMKMFQSYQQIWADAFKDMNELVFEKASIPTDIPVDIDFPDIAPSDVFSAAQSIATLITAIPDFATIRDVQQVALLSLGINNTDEILDDLQNQTESMSEAKVLRALKLLKEVLRKNGS